jgi:hypothetical protein
MAVLSVGLNGNVVRVWGDGLAELTALYALRKVTAGDTIDLSPDFNPPLRAVLLGTTLVGTASVTSFSGNVLTMPGGNNDAAYLLVFGVHA